MSSRKTWAHDMAKRVDSLGWRVEKHSSGAYKVWMPPCPDDRCNHLMQFHLSASDVNAERTVLRELNAHGLAKAELRAREKRANDKARRIAEDRAAADAALSRVEEENMKAVQFSAPEEETPSTGPVTRARRTTKSAVARAAGPYLSEAEDVGITWFAQKHPAPWMRWVNITPEIAKYLLDNHNDPAENGKEGANRRINERQVDHYKRIIQSGQWHLTHQGVAMDTEANLQDGQHRLSAVVDAAAEMGDPGLKVPFAFFVGMPVENFKAIDEGLLRTAAQLFVKGGEKNGSTLQTAIRLAMAYGDPDGKFGFRIKMPNQILVDKFAEDPDGFREAANHAQSHYKKYHSSSGAVAAAMYLIKRANGRDNPFVAAFFEGLMTGRKAGTRMVLDDADPRNVYRETMINAKLGSTKRRISSRDQMAMIILSWNNMLNNVTPRYMKFPEGSPIPRVLVCKPETSACPALLHGEVDGDDE